MTELDRRTLLKRGAAVTAGSAVLGGPFAGYVAGGAQAKHRGKGKPNTRGLTPVADLRDGQTRLALPKGFRYRSFQPSSRTSPLILDDGARMPGRHDGMAAFRGPGGDVTLIRNHEENGPGSAFGPPGSPIYDENAPGGTSTVEVTHEGVVLHSYASISGTQMNCSGGPMPWGAWVTCEETVNGPDVGNDFTGQDNTLLTKPHGAIFEVPVNGDATAEPITMAGRFAHEAVSLDPKEGALYLSEDNFNFPSGFYKYVPPQHPMKAGRLMDGGKLYMLKVKGVWNAELARSQPNGTTYKVEWVGIEDPWFDDGTTITRTNDEAIQYVGQQGRAQGAAKFSRLEGTVYDHNTVYFSSTQGGGGDPEAGAPNGDGGYGNGWGQVWAYHVRSQKLELVFESPNRDVLDFPDNVTSSRRGTLVLCEDHDESNFLRGLTRGGQLFDIAENVSTRPNDEFAGSTFSHDGDTLYVNQQSSTGLSFAIWGPWEKIGV
jgi:secreted PhoX family phosphatase